GLGSSATRDAYSTSGKMLSEGDFGVGSQNPVAMPQDESAGYTNYPNGFYAALGQWIQTPGDISGQSFGIINVGLHQSSSTTWRGQIGLSYSTSGRMFFRCTTSGSWNTWRELYHSANTTKASDGTLKAASPVVKLFAEGSFETNDESQGCTVTRLRIGEYLVEGCEGLNSDAAWGGIDGGFDIPTDRNKQPLIWLDYEVNADGSVLVKTYHRTHPAAPAFARNELPGINDGDPVDIPRDQFVSVRVEMPVDSLYNQKLRAAELEMTASDGE
ncbi:pyocin knob domain-containing protein, partial [Enterobacter asburiae]|uniref:pyocin knob domain-containing protein n=1 Tax=Enterobacter asburiae TaxID=61645 RepID=UPI0020762CDC